MVRHILCPDRHHSQIACAFVHMLKSFSEDQTPGEHGNQFRHLDLYVDGQAAIDRYESWVSSRSDLSGNNPAGELSAQERETALETDGIRRSSMDLRTKQGTSDEPTCWADIVLEDPEHQSLLEEEAARSSALLLAEKNQQRIQEMASHLLEFPVSLAHEIFISPSPLFFSLRCRWSNGSSKRKTLWVCMITVWRLRHSGGGSCIGHQVVPTQSLFTWRLVVGSREFFSINCIDRSAPGNQRQTSPAQRVSKA